MTPKQRFLQSAYAKKHGEWADTDTALAACDAALLELFEEMPDTGDINGSWDMANRMKGARRVLQILLSLSKPVEPLKHLPLAGPKLKPPQ
jgi:hypothetical protein